MAECKFFCFFRALLFSILAPLNYLGADIRTERFRSKPISAPKGLGRGPNANSSAFSGPFFFQFGPLLITKGGDMIKPTSRSKAISAPGVRSRKPEKNTFGTGGSFFTAGSAYQRADAIKKAFRSKAVAAPKVISRGLGKSSFGPNPLILPTGGALIAPRGTPSPTSALRGADRPQTVAGPDVPKYAPGTGPSNPRNGSKSGVPRGSKFSAIFLKFWDLLLFNVINSGGSKWSQGE